VLSKPLSSSGPSAIFDEGDIAMHKSPWRENRSLGRP
jgi:hypothetical protein